MKYTIYYESNLNSYGSYSDNELLDMYKSGDENARIALAKRNHNISGDIYFVRGFMANKESHKSMFPNSVAETIVEMAQEYVDYIEQ